MSDSRYRDVKFAAPIEVFKLTADYNKNTNPLKVNLGVGAYRTNDGNPWVLPVVKSVEQAMAKDETLNHEYLPISGYPDFCEAGIRLVLGEDSPAIAENKTGSVQALGGTGALRIAAEFLNTCLKYNLAYVSTPTWGNHVGIFKRAGFNVKKYRYWDDDKRKVDFDLYIQDLKAAPENSVVILHACAHNPTGMDPSTDQWEVIAAVVKERQLFPVFDCAYQGFATGDLQADAWAVRMFVERGIELIIAQSFSKNFGLYNERVGNCIVVSSDADNMVNIISQMKLLVRVMWSNPPNHGSRVVATVLNNPALLAEWKENIKSMANRILLMRLQLVQKLKKLGTPGTWDHILEQKGMFSYTGLNERQAEFLKEKHHIYLLKSGRITMCGLTSHNIDYVALAIHEAVTTKL